MSRPRVAWAARSPAGPAALVVQQLVVAGWNLGQKPGVENRTIWVAGHLGVDRHGAPRVVAVSSPHERVESWYVDPAETTVALLDADRARRTASEWNFWPVGARQPRSLEWIDPAEGWTFVRVDSGRPTPATADIADPRHIEGLAPVDEADLRVLRDEAQSINFASTPAMRGIGVGPFLATGRLPNGHAIALLRVQRIGEEPGLAILERTGDPRDPARYSDVDPVTTGPALSVWLTDHSGTVHVIPGRGGTLRYQSAGGAWSPPARDALFVPRGALQTEVTPAN